MAAGVRVIAPISEATLPLWVAEDKGFFAESDVTVTVTEGSDPARMLAELHDRRHEFAIVLLEDVLAFNARNAQQGIMVLPAYAIASITGGVSRFVLSREVKALRELKGRRIAIDSPESGQATLWTTFLEGEGLAPGTYELVPLGADRARLDALTKGQVDATMLLPAEANRAQDAGLTVLNAMGKETPLIGHVYAVSSRWLQSVPARNAFLQACVQAMDWLHEPANRTEAATLLRKRMPALSESQATETIAALTSGAPGYSGGCAFDRKQVNLALRGILTRTSAPPLPQSIAAIVWSAPENARQAMQNRAKRDGAGGMYAVAEPLQGVLRPNADFAKAERALDQALRTRSRMDDGTWVLQAMFMGFRTTIADSGWETVETRLAAWRAADPNSVHSRLAEAWYWSEYAWEARGSDAASNVPKQAFELMRVRLSKAQAVLDEIRPRALDHPVWHWTMQHVAFAAGIGADERAAILAEAVRREPSFVAHYTEFARGLTPRWGGNVKAYRAFADAAVERSRATEGKSMYAWLYPLLTYVEHDQDPFKDLGIPWNDLRSGFEDLLVRHPRSKTTLHLFASFACRAEDRKTFQGLRQKLVRSDFPVAGAYSWEYCNEVLLQRS